MNFLQSFSSLTRTLSIATIVFLLYGYLCRFASINFFWESKTIGWMLFWMTVICLLRDSIKALRLRHIKPIIPKIGIGLSIFILLIKGILFFAIQQTSAYDAAVRFIKTNPEMLRESGAVRGVFLVPFGGMAMSTNAKGSSGEADLYFIVKGAKKYTDLHLVMGKDFDTEWQIAVAGE